MSDLLASKSLGEVLGDGGYRGDPVGDEHTLVVVDAATYTIVQANEAFHQWAQLPYPEAIGRPCYAVMAGRSSHCRENSGGCPVEEMLLSGKDRCRRLLYPNGDGRGRLELTGYPLTNEAGKIESVICLGLQRPAGGLAGPLRAEQRPRRQLDLLLRTAEEIHRLQNFCDLIHYVDDIFSACFPGTEFVPLLFNASREGFLEIECCREDLTARVKDLVRVANKAQGAAQVNLADIDRAGVYTGSRPGPLAPLFEPGAGRPARWLAVPVSDHYRCFGFFLLMGAGGESFGRSDIDFVRALVGQVATHLHQLAVAGSVAAVAREDPTVDSFQSEIVGRSKKMKEVFELIELVAGSDATVLITGANGTGKELVAHAIHRRSHRSDGPFIIANCSAYSPTLLESELFGHEKGAFTGAIRKKMGRIERAQGGSLFLDEIGDIAAATQVLLLRFLQDHRFERVGGEVTLEADVRILAATNRNLHREVEAGRFRDDLYYRLNVIAIHLPMLKERKEDIPLLCQHFLKRYTAKERKLIRGFSSGAMQTLLDYDWPGNVRQLENAVSHAVILAQDEIIHRRHLPRFLVGEGEPVAATSLAENERRLILRVLRESHWNKHEAARRLQISRSTLYSKIRRYRIEPHPG